MILLFSISGVRDIVFWDPHKVDAIGLGSVILLFNRGSLHGIIVTSFVSHLCFYIDAGSL